MKEFILYSILIALLYIYSGIGLTLLLIPKNLEKYSLYLSPFVGLSYLSYIGWFFVHYSSDSMDVYARLLLLPPIIFLIISMIIKKNRISELFWPFKKENLLLIVICVVVFTGISTPYLLRVDGLNAMNLGNADIINYAATAKFMTHSFSSQNNISMAGYFHSLTDNDVFGAYLSTAIPSSIFSLETYKLQNITIYLFYTFLLPIIFLVGFEIFKYNRYFSMVIAFLSAINAHLIFILYQSYLSQVIGGGILLCLFLFMFYPVLNCKKLVSFFPYIPLASLFTFSLMATYITLVPLFFIPLIICILLIFMNKKSIYNFINPFIFLSLTLLATFLILPSYFISRINYMLSMTKVIVGWNLPLFSPDWIFGLVGNNMSGWRGTIQSLPIVYRIILSILIVLIITASLIHLFKKERNIFYISISFLSFIFLFYCYLIIKERLSPSFTGEGYKAYKLITYFIPIILLSGLCYFRNFRLLSTSKITKNQMLSIIFLVFLIAGNISSSMAMIEVNYHISISIKENIIGLQKLEKMDNVSSINILENDEWEQMWINYFLFMDKKLYLQIKTYYPASPLLGEWTLRKSGPRYNSFKMNIRFPSGLSGSQEPLITTGKTGAGDFIFVRYISDGKIAFKFDHWGTGGPESNPILVDNNRFYPMEVLLDRDSSMVIIKFEGGVLRYSSPLYPTAIDEITIGENRIGGTGPGPRFSGEIQDLIKATDVFDGIISIADIESDIIEINKDYYISKNKLVATLSKGWYGIESNQYTKWRWTGEKNETPTIEIDVHEQMISVDIRLNYWTLETNNEFSVFLDNRHIKDCKDNISCSLNDIVISKGKHEIAFKEKLPPRTYGNRDPRILGYAFSDINIMINKVKTGVIN